MQHALPADVVAYAVVPYMGDIDLLWMSVVETDDALLYLRELSRRLHCDFGENEQQHHHEQQRPREMRNYLLMRYRSPAAEKLLMRVLECRQISVALTPSLVVAVCQELLLRDPACDLATALRGGFGKGDEWYMLDPASHAHTQLLRFAELLAVDRHVGWSHSMTRATVRRVEQSVPWAAELAGDCNWLTRRALLSTSGSGALMKEAAAAQACRVVLEVDRYQRPRAVILHQGQAILVADCWPYREVSSPPNEKAKRGRLQKEEPRVPQILVRQAHPVVQRVLRLMSLAPQDTRVDNKNHHSRRLQQVLSVSGALALALAHARFVGGSGLRAVDDRTHDRLDLTLCAGSGVRESMCRISHRPYHVARVCRGDNGLVAVGSLSNLVLLRQWAEFGSVRDMPETVYEELATSEAPRKRRRAETYLKQFRKTTSLIRRFYMAT